MNHEQMMKPMVVGMAALAVLALAGAPVLGYAPLLIVLVCPLMMILMMAAMMSIGRMGGASREQSAAAPGPQDDRTVR